MQDVDLNKGPSRSQAFKVQKCLEDEALKGNKGWRCFARALCGVDRIEVRCGVQPGQELMIPRGRNKDG